LQLPTFIHKNQAVNESLAICDYLEVNTNKIIGNVLINQLNLCFLVWI